MTEPHDRKLQTVAALLRQAEDAQRRGEDSEHVAFQMRAFELMAKYGLDEALVRDRKDRLDPTNAVKATNVMIRLDGKYKPMQAVLLAQICTALHCEAFQTASMGKIAIQVFGMPDHLRRVQDLWGLLAPQALRGMEAAEPPYGYTHSGELRVYRRNWLSGFGQEVHKRIHAAEHAAAGDAGALVLYQGDAKKAELAMTETYPRWQKIKSRRYYDRNGHQQGKMAGQSAQLQRSLD